MTLNVLSLLTQRCKEKGNISSFYLLLYIFFSFRILLNQDYVYFDVPCIRLEIRNLKIYTC